MRRVDADKAWQLSAAKEAYLCGGRKTVQSRYCANPCAWIQHQVGKDMAKQFAAEGVNTVSDLLPLRGSQAEGENEGEQRERIVKLRDTLRHLGFEFDPASIEFKRVPQQSQQQPHGTDIDPVQGE